MNNHPSHLISISNLIIYIFSMLLTCHYTHIVLLLIITIALLQIYYKSRRYLLTTLSLIINLYLCTGGKLNSTLECLFVCLLDIMLYLSK